MGDSCFSDMGRMPDDGDLDETDPKADILTSDFALVTPTAEGAAPAGLGTEVTLADGRSPAATERPVPSVPGYEIVRELGRGGMGVVYLAHQGRLNRLCALKMILAGAHANSEASGRFLTEAEAVARLHHPGIIQIHCIGEAGGLPFIEFEYVDGGSLDQGLDGTPWPPRRATALVEQLTRAVAEAHRRGIVHRDLKPANILLSSDGTPKITDFGLAKSLGINADLTRTNSILGSPSYMAPEQADGKTRDVGPAADLYSLGAILYELLTGRPPFRGATVLETLEQVKGTEAVPPSRLVPGLSRDLETICLVCLRKEPERRYASAGALAEDLRRSLSGETILARRRGPAQRAWRWCRRNPMVAALAASVLLLLTALAIGSSIAAFRLNAQRNAILAHQHRAERAEAQRRVLLVDSLLSAEPDVVPFLVDSLRPARNHVLPRLRRMFADPAGSSRQQLRVAVALTLLGEPKSLFLIESIPTAPVNECRNLVSALATVKCSVVDDLRRHAETARDPATLARFASVLLSLGEPGVARNTLAPRDDPAERVALTHGFAAWHGSLNALPDLFRSTNDPAFRSSLAAAVGLIEPGTLLPEERIGLERALSDLHRDDPTAATHSATGWALRHWGIKPPTIAPTPAPSLGRHWFVNGQGMTLVEVPPGIFVMGGPRGIVPHWVALTRTVFMSDREVRADSFERFVADPRCPAEEKPKDWPGINKDVSPTGDCPANNVSWVDQILFCNWLSRREGRQPCYEHTGPGPAAWRCDFDADGYRLPTAAEWEYACRAGTTTRYPFGDQPDLLTSYGEVERLQTLPCGSRLPNAWGLFDMIGNVWESCWDGTEEQGLTFRLDPIGHAPNSLYDMRGGGRGAGGIHTLSGYRILKSAGFRDSDNGFRVVCGIPGAKADPRRRVDDLATSSLRRHEGPQAEAALHIVLGFWYHQYSEPAKADAQFARADELAASLTPGSGDGPALAAIWRGLATWYESHSCWLEAAARYAKAVVANPEDPNLHRYLAIARLLSGDMSGYRSACAAMLDRFGGTTDPAIALPVTVACVYAPGAVADMADLVRLATTAVTSDSDSERYLGYAHFRAGRFQEALNRVEKVHGNSLLDLWNQLYAGMAHQRLGNAYEARRLLLQARRWMDKADRAPPGSAGKNQPGWTTVMDRDYADHLYRELETLLNGPAPDLPANVFAP